MPRTFRSINKSKQLKVNAAAKKARRNEAGLGGRRTGRELAATQRAQARRDALQLAADVEAGNIDVVAPVEERHVTAKSKRPKLAVQVNTSSTVPGDARLDEHVSEVVNAALLRFAGRLTRVEVHLSDENKAKRGTNDKRCLIEARPASQRPLSTSASANTIEAALREAAGKMKRLLATRLADRKRG